MCKKRKLNVTVNDYTYPSPSEAIQQNEQIVAIDHDVSIDNTHVSNDNITMKTRNQTPRTN